MINLNTLRYIDLEKRLNLLNRDLSQLQEAQSELYFLYQATGRKMSNNSQFLEYIKTFQNTGNLREIRRLLNMEDVKKPVSRPEREKKAEQPTEVVDAQADGGEALTLNQPFGGSPRVWVLGNVWRAEPYSRTTRLEIRRAWLPTEHSHGITGVWGSLKSFKDMLRAVVKEAGGNANK